MGCPQATGVGGLGPSGAVPDAFLSCVGVSHHWQDLSSSEQSCLLHNPMFVATGTGFPGNGHGPSAPRAQGALDNALRHMVALLGCPMQGQKLDSMIFRVLSNSGDSVDLCICDED